MPVPLFPLLASVIAFVTGLAVGSFLNVAILRGLRGEKLDGRSRCDNCGKVLHARELIPIASYFLQKGRCRSCGAAFSVQHPIVEAATALAFGLWAWWAFAHMPPVPLPLMLASFPALAALIVLMVSDIRFQILPDGAILILALAGFAASVARGAILADALAAGAIALFFAGLWFFSKGRWMGLGDAKLAFVTSLAVGFPASLAAFLFSFWLGGLAGALLLLSGRKDLQSRIPFGPFLIAGALLAHFFSASFLTFTGLSAVL